MTKLYEHEPLSLRTLLLPIVVTAVLVALSFTPPFTSAAYAQDAGAVVEVPETSPSDLPPPIEPVAPETDTPEQTVQSSCGRCCRRAKVRCCRPRCFPRIRRHCCQGCCDSTGDASAGNAPDPFAAVDLFDGKTLTGWKIANFGGEGEVEVKDGMIVLPMGMSMTGVTYTGEVPRTNYELSLEGMRLDGTDFFCTTTFAVGEKPCTLVVGGWGGTVVGLSNVDFYDASDNSTTTFQEFKDKQWYRIRIRVTDAKVEAWIDDNKVVTQERAGHKFGIRYEVELCQPLGVSTWDTTGAIRNIRLRTLKPEEVEAAQREVAEPEPLVQ